MHVGGWARVLCLSGALELNVGLMVGFFSVLLVCYGVLVYGPVLMKAEKFSPWGANASE